VRIVQLLIIFYLKCFKLQLIFNENSIVNRNWYWRRHLGFSDSGFANIGLSFQVMDESRRRRIRCFIRHAFEQYRAGGGKIAIKPYMDSQTILIPFDMERLVVYPPLA